MIWLFDSSVNVMVSNDTGRMVPAMQLSEPEQAAL